MQFEAGGGDYVLRNHTYPIWPESELEGGASTDQSEVGLAAP